MILLVIKDHMKLTLLMSALEKEGYKIITSDSQKEAENIIQKTPADLAIFDLKLEFDDSGFVLAYKLKKMNKNIPVIVMASTHTKLGLKTGILSEEDKKWIKADIYLEKEDNTENLMKYIKNVLKS